jgi:hypothetical protein
MTETQNSQVTFTKIMGKWAVKGPTSIITEKATITVSKADGTTTRVYIRLVSTLGQPEGTAIGHFTDAAKHEAEVIAAAEYAILEEAYAAEQLAAYAIKMQAYDAIIFAGEAAHA